MKSIYSFILLFFITSLALFSEAIGKLSKSKIKKGEPLTLEIVVEGRPNLKVPNQVVKSGGVAAEYVGTEENISIINGRTSQRKKLKFRIVTSKDGKLKTPVIPVIVDGVSEDVASIPFEVSKEKYEPPQVTSPFDDFDFPFNRMRKKPKRTTSPSPDDFVVMFHTNRDYVYLGETLVGYYILFYKNTDGFYLQRDDYKLPDFPFFLSEMLYDVGIETPRETIYNGKKYSLQPYQKEIYALTPLRKGTFSLGNAKFSIIDSGMEFDTSQKTIDSKPKNIKVFDLPSPSPPNFSGEVGVYKPFIELKKQTINLGETIPLILKVKGEGTGTLIKDPLANFCPNEECGARITFLNENRNRKFIKLDENRYGFST
ncbi:MAG: BatD family protein, partial [Leptospiraceae bacterium]|nr:BatD family protein [Leptospiraceae bacterium]